MAEHLSADQSWMQRALELAVKAESEGEVPVGAVIVHDGSILAEGWNRTIGTHDPTAHAEIIALRRAGRRLHNYRMPACTMYVTLEPCGMCISAIIHARLDRLVFAAPDPKTGALGGNWNILEATRHNHDLSVEGGVLAREAGDRLRAFFRARR